MSKELNPIENPGLPEHVHRRTDVDPVAEKRAERQVASLFALSAISTVGFIYAYVFVKKDSYTFIPILGEMNVQQLLLGLFMAGGFLFIGIGAIAWARQLMPDSEVIAHRHEFRSSDEDRKEFVDTVKSQGAAAGIGRRPLIKRTLGAALGLVGLGPVILLRDLGPLPGKELEKTSWKAGTRLVTDPGDRYIKASDLEVGAVVQTLPEVADPEHRSLNDIAKDPVLLIRLRPEDFNLDAERLSWTHEGIIAFSKICSHMGCAVALYEQQTHHLLCPCHQSTFDVTRAAKVIFGPAARPLPQLAITVDAEGYLIAKQPFTEPVGPSFWERNSQ
ncbi:MAG: cytochrome bc1 complex Rieske iron-sulfur subunit [Candidatus Nanopelagicaceae bacterium]